jgi:hypothetical protein
MTAFRNSVRLVLAALVADAAQREHFLVGFNRELRDLARGRNLYEVFADPSPLLRRALDDRFGDGTAQAMRELYQAWAVNPAQAEEILDLTRHGMVLGTYDELAAVMRGTSISRLLEREHIVEQRLHRMILDGIDGHAARTLEQASPILDVQKAVERGLGAMHLHDGVVIRDGLCALQPANEVVVHNLNWHWSRITRREGAGPLLYTHQGINSKTDRMRQLVPWRLEGHFSYQQLLDATRWSARRATSRTLTRGADVARIRAEFESLDILVRDDLIESIVTRLEFDDDLARHVLPAIGRRNVSPTSPRVPQALRNYLRLDPLTAERFTAAGRWPHLPPIIGPSDEAEEAARAIEAATNRRTRRTEY